MNPFRLFFGAAEVGARDASSDFWYGRTPTTPDGQVFVSAASVQQIPEVYACLTVLSQTIAALPLGTFKRKPDGSKEKADAHPIAALLKSRPNKLQTAFEFRAQMTWDLVLHRNAFAEIVEGARGPVDQLVRLDPETVWMVKLPGSTGYVWEVRDGAGARRRIDPEFMFQLRATPLTSDNILGRSLIQDGAPTFARALALQDYARRFFENDATPGGVIEIPGRFTKELAAEFKEKWQNQFTGKNRHKVGVLDGGAKFSPIPLQNDKAQFIETYREVALQLLRFWRMPPHKVGMLERATNNNIEHQGLEFVTDTLLPWLVAWEQAISRDLIIASDYYFAEHNVAGLLRGDVKARYEAYRIGREWGWLSANDVRALENMNPIDSGDAYLQPLNMGPAGSVQAQRAAFQAYVDNEVAHAMSERKLIEGKVDALR